jgi:protein pelota
VKLIYKDLRRGTIRLQVESIDDLWLLSMTIEPGDLVRAKTVREVKFGGRGSGRSSRVPMVLTVRVEAVEFQPFTSRLRVRGVVVEGPERFGVKGKRHTISIDVGSELEVTKPGGWPRSVLEKLESKGLGVSLVVVAVDYDEYAIAVVRDQGVRYIVEDYTRLPGKDDPAREEALKQLVAVVANSTASVVERERPDAVIVAGPGTLKSMVAEKLGEKLKGVKLFTESVSTGGRAGVEEALRRGVARRIAKEVSALMAEEVLERFEELVVKDPELIAYGRGRVLQAIEAGAVEVLAILDQLLYSADPEERSWVLDLLRRADETRARVIFVPSSSPAGEKLRGLGGVIAVLRYRLPYEEGVEATG